MKTYKVTLEFKSIVTKTVLAETEAEAVLMANRMVTDHDLTRGFAGAAGTTSETKMAHPEFVYEGSEMEARDREHGAILSARNGGRRCCCEEDEHCWADPTWDR